jgi:hypothetical protein
VKDSPYSLVSLDRAVSIAQFLSIVGGIWWLGSEVGRRDLQLTMTMVGVNELSSIVRDLASAQVANATADAGAMRELTNLRSRLERLETEQRKAN